MSTPVLEARDLGWSVRGKAILQGVDHAFAGGDFCAVVGPNGSGKTTLLRLLAGVLRPTTGAVRLDGRPIGDLPRGAVARRLAYVPQNTWTEFDVTVWDAVAMGRLPYLGAWRSMGAGDLERVHAALARVDLAELAERTLPSLSGGERQRVFLARCLAQESPVLVLDEPTASLDIGHQFDLVEVLRVLHGEGRTIVLAVHDLRLVWDAVPDSLVLDGGRVVARGPSREVLRGEAVRAAFGVDLEAGQEGLRIGRRTEAGAP